MNGDMTYCANKDCPFSDCIRHLDNAPKKGVISMAWLDKTCVDFIGWVEADVIGGGLDE